MAGDANYGNVVLLLTGNGTIADKSPSPKTVTVNGDAQISTAQYLFGGESIYFDGTGDYLSLGTPQTFSDFNLGSSDLSIEFDVRPTGTDTYAIIGNLNNGTGSGHFWVVINSTYTGLHTVQFGTTGVTSKFGTSALPAGSWSNIGIYQSGTSLKCFKDGTQLGSTLTVSSFSGTLTNDMRVGATSDGVLGLNGYLANLRATKGIARQSSTFTPSTVAYPDYAGQVSGIVRDSSNALCDRTVRAYNRSTGALVASTTSNGTTGAYTLNCSAAGEVTVLFLDDAAGTVENDLVLRTTPG